MECGAGGAVATDRSSIPLRTTTCVNLCEGITYGRRTRAHLRGFDRLGLRATSVAGRARGAGVATRVLFVCCRRVCDMASTFLFSFFSVSRTFVHRCRSPGTRSEGAGVGNRGKSTMSVRDVSSIVRGRQGPRAENHGRSAARRGMPRSARRRRAARARNAHELTQTAEYSAPRPAAIRGTARASGSERNGTCTWTISGRSRTR